MLHTAQQLPFLYLSAFCYSFKTVVIFFGGGGHTQTHTQRQTQRFVLQPVQRAIMWLTGK